MPQHQISLSDRIVFLFTQTATETISDLSCAMYQNIKLCARSHAKIFGDRHLFDYVDEFRYRMGYGIAHFSYCSWEGDVRKGIVSGKMVRGLAGGDGSLEKYEDLQQYIE